MITKEELELCAELMGVPNLVQFFDPEHDDGDLVRLARAAGLVINYTENCIGWYSVDGDDVGFGWPSDGTEAECVIKAAAAVARARKA